MDPLRKDAGYRLTRWEWLFCGAYLVFAVLWMVAKPFDSAPDEAARYLLPKYIFLHGSLPDGNMAAVRIPQWGFSYAHYPLFLGPLLSALGMKLASLFAPGSVWVMWGARLPSALAAAGTVVVTLMAGKRLLGRPYHWLAAGVVAFLPQFLFLGSYVNNDILAVFGSGLVLLGWVRGLQEQWNWKNCLVLAAGIVVVALSYYNAYGWILCSLPLFFLSFLLQKEKKPGWQKEMLKAAGLICGVVILCAGFFFLRNALLYDGDFLGLSAASAASEQYGEDFLKPSNRATPKNLGLSLWEMLGDTQNWGAIPWPQRCWQSFIGVFGYMSVNCPEPVYQYYAGVFALGGAGLAAAAVLRLKKRRESPLEGRWLLLYALMAAAALITLGLSMYYSYAVDYQAQGRYLYPMLLPIALFTAKGLGWLIRRLSPAPAARAAWVGAFCGFSAAVAWLVYHLVFLPY